eukprot:1342872-Pyramimonas_sp.AAC.1
METGRTPSGKLPIIEQPYQVYSNVLDGTAPCQEPKLPMLEAYEIAQTKVKNVVIPPGGSPEVP